MKNARETFHILTRRFSLLNKNCCSVNGREISLVQSHILYEVGRQYKPSMQEIAEILGTDITTFSRQVQSLVKLNLVQKTPDDKDRRIFTLSLTEEGVHVADAIEEQMNHYLEDVFSHMTQFEQDTLLRAVKLFNEVMSKADLIN